MQTVALKLKVHIFGPYCALSRVCLRFLFSCETSRNVMFRNRLHDVNNKPLTRKKLISKV